ncbi:MAG: tetratricopeptide repeat protein [Bacteroidales bacterium]|nr:tetratricopeptide repeat protein [Bacteroidales bacterium]
MSNEIKNLLRRDNIDATFFKSEALGITAENFKEHDQIKIDRELLTCDLSLFLFKTRAGEGTRHEYDVACDLKKREKNHTITICCLNVPEDEKEDDFRVFQQRLVDEGVVMEVCGDMSEVRRVISFSVLHHLGISLPSTPKTDTAKRLGDDLFHKINETGQEELKPQLHGVIDDLLTQIPVIMASPTDSIVAKIVKASELYYKANIWASKTCYNEGKYCDLLFKYAQFLLESGLYYDAEKVYCDLLMPIAEKTWGVIDKNTASLYNEIGELYWKMAYFHKSLEFHKKALIIREKELGVDHCDTASTYNDIGMVFHEIARYCQYLEHPIDNNTSVSFELNNYEMAMSYLNKALTIREKVLGTYHSDTAVSYNNIGLLYRNQGNSSQAIEYHKKALEIRKKVLGKNHSDTASSYNNLGVAYLNLNNNKEALINFFEALEIDKNTIGADHPETSYDYHNIGMTYYDERDYKNAIVYLKEALRIRIESMGHNHPETLKTKKYLESAENFIMEK